jgi:thiol:disulfide interchange protein
MSLGLALMLALASTAKLADGHVQAELLTDVSTVRSGDGFRAGVVFRLDPEWHIYWHNPGEAGMSTELGFKGEVAEFGALAWPVPTRILSRDGYITTYGYEQEVLLFVPARARASGEIAVDVSLLACKVDCIPGEVTLGLPLVVGDASRPSPSAPRFDAAAARVPRPGTFTTRIRPEVVRPGDGFTIEIQGSCAGRCTPSSVPFFPHRTPSVTLKPTAARNDADGFTVTIAGTAGPDDPKQDQAVAGVLAFDDAPPLAWTATLRRTAPASGPPLALVLGLAFLGGLILNLMPCVLPVLAIKVVGFTRLVGEGKRLAAHGIAYAAGIQLALGTIAAAVLVLRALGTEVGWGFQFQHPVFVAVVGAILVLLAENAFGVFEIGVAGTGAVETVSRARGLLRSVAEGGLAVVLATPCSAPFLGTAVGVALVSPAPVVILVFVALGLGLAAPFVLLTLIPAARRLVPRPGVWMERLKELLGFALLGAAAWLLWIYGRQTEDVPALLVLWLLVAFGGWLVGRMRRRWLAVALAMVLVGGYAAYLVRPAGPGKDALSWRAWDEAAVAADVRAGRPVLVDFTADWCLTCKVNERVALDTAAVKRKVDDAEVALYRADFTRPDENIRRALARHGKAGVPMYLVYSPAAPDAPEVLPELLTEHRVLEALDRAQQRRIE